MAETKTVHIGPGLPTLLTLLFVGLKLTGYIDWAWVWVLAPVWIPLVFMAAGALFVVVIALLVGAFGR